MEKKILRIAFVPTAGAREEIFWKEHKLARIFTRPTFRNVLVAFGLKIRVVFSDNLEKKTISRLKKAAILYCSGKIDLIYVYGEDDKNRCVQIPILMRSWLIRDADLPAEAICCGIGKEDSSSLMGFITAFMQERMDVWVCSSWWQNGMIISRLRKAAKRPRLDDWRSVPEITYRS